MTTIAYNHKDKEIAFDSRTTRGDTIVRDNANKAITNSKGTFIFAGSSADCAIVASEYPNTPEKTVNSYGFAIVKGVVNWISFNDDGINIQEINYNESAGSGQDHALTAMDLGLSAKDAVKMAIKRDNGSGGKIRVFKVKE